MRALVDLQRDREEPAGLAGEHGLRVGVVGGYRVQGLLVVAERSRVTEALRKLHVDVPESQANFVWLPLGDQAAQFGAICEGRGVIVRPFQGDGVRVTIGTPEENDAFLAAAEAALEQLV